MSSCTSCSTAAQTYQSAQSYIKQQLNAASKPEPQDNAAPAGPEGLNSSGRGRLLNVKA